MKENAKKRTLRLITAALFTAITAVLSQTAIPTPFDVPLTLQTFAVALCGYVLGVKWGLASTAAYIPFGHGWGACVLGLQGRRAGAFRGDRRIYFRLPLFNRALRSRRAHKK